MKLIKWLLGAYIAVGIATTAVVFVAGQATGPGTTLLESTRVGAVWPAWLWQAARP